jgi:hypothetical protein
VALSLKERQALAVAIDLNLSFSGRLKLMNILEPLSRDFAFHLIERADEFLSIEKNYIGYVTDPDIVSKISGIWDKHPKVRNEILDNVLNRAFRESLITGCLIKNKHDLANFDSNLTISYSHSNIKHVKQLIGLLASEHLQAKLQLEPKRSSFIYLKEWERMPDINLESIEEGIDIAHKDEFDIVMEFTSQEHRDGFRNLIESYARTEAENDHNVLYESWRQPLFTSKIPLAGYTRIGEIIIRDASHLAVSYAREKEIAEKLEWFSRETKDMEVTVSHVWVNEAFFRYLDRNSS